MQEFERVTGLDFVQAHTESWSQALEHIQNGEADVLLQVVNTEERREYMSFTDPHYTVNSVFGTLSDEQMELGDPSLRLLTPRDYAIEAWLDENHPDIDYRSVASLAEGFELLLSGEADALLDAWPVLHAAADSAGITLYDGGNTGFSYDLAIGYGNDLPILGSILQKALDSIPPHMLEQAYVDAVK